MEINGIEYQTGKLDAFSQLHVARRIAPLLTTLAVAGDLKEAADWNPALAAAFAKMSDEDVDYVIKKCLKVCQRKQARGWSSVVNQTGVLQFDDMNAGHLIQLCIEVITDNLQSFFPTSQPSQENETAVSTT